MLHRRALVLAILSLANAGHLHAQSPWQPSRPIRLMVGFSPGTTSDVLARLLAQRLSDRLGVPVVVENREGAGGTIAAAFLLRQPADGHTIMIASTGLTIGPQLYRNVTYKPLEDFEPIGLVGYAPNVLVVSNTSPIHSIAELIERAKAKPNGLRYASSGTGSASWTSMEALKSMAEIQLEEVPYSSTAQATTDAISGRVDLHFPSLAGAMPHIRSGQLRPLGITSATRSEGAPDIPSIAETVPGYDTSSWYGILAPAGLPEPVLQRLGSELQAAVAMPEMQRQLLELGVDPAPAASGGLRRVIEAAVTSVTALLDRIGYRPQ